MPPSVAQNAPFAWRTIAGSISYVVIRVFICKHNIFDIKSSLFHTYQWSHFVAIITQRR